MARRKTNSNRRVQEDDDDGFDFRGLSSGLSGLSREVSAIILFGFALFFHICNHYTASTGILGKFIVVAHTLLFGRVGFDILPLFMLLPAISFVMTPIRRGIILFASSASFFCFVILSEMLHHAPMDPFVFPPPPSPYGGVLGTIFYYLLDKLIGVSGLTLLIYGVFLGSTILVFGVSIKKLTLLIIRLLEQSLNAIGDRSLFQNSGPLFYKKASKPSIFKKMPAYNPNPLPDSSQSTQVDLLDSKIIPATDFDLKLSPAEPEAEPHLVSETPPNITLTHAHKQNKSALSTSFTHAGFKLPPITLLKPGQVSKTNTQAQIKERYEQARLLEETLKSFGVAAKVINVTAGPSVTRYELQPGEGVKIAKITALSRDIALKLAAPDIRIEAPIPGKALVGIEVPNVLVDTVTIRGIMEQTDFYDQKSRLLTVLGLTITGEPTLMDLSRMPHIMIAGATGSGKSVCINAIILSILMRSTPDEVKFLMIDPKKVELSLYQDIPHLLAPVVTNPNKAAATLKKWALIEMENRYELFSNVGVKDIESFNVFVMEKKEKREARALHSGNHELDTPETEVLDVLQKLPYIVVVIDELADLMMVAAQDVEQTICRLAQMARATGIHLVIATQRPSVNVVTGLIKANVPSRISFFLQSQIDSRTILDMSGAEKLLGRGDMLYSPVGAFKPIRAQGVFVTESEVKNVVNWLKKQGAPDYVDAILDVEPLTSSDAEAPSRGDETDVLYEEAKNLVISTQYASTSYLQRKLRIGYNRAARIMDQMEAEGLLSEHIRDKKARSIT